MFIQMSPTLIPVTFRPLSFKLFVSCPRWSMCLSLISHMQIINIIIILVCCHNYCRARKQTFNQPEQNYCHPPWAMMFADDLVLCAMTREEVEEHLETWRVVFDRQLKDKVFKSIIRPAMTYGSECWAVKKKYENKLNSAEMRMLRWARGKTRLDHIRNETSGRKRT